MRVCSRCKPTIIAEMTIVRSAAQLYQPLLRSPVLSSRPCRKASRTSSDIGIDAEFAFDEVTRIGHGLRADMECFADLFWRLFGEQHAQNFELRGLNTLTARGSSASRLSASSWSMSALSAMRPYKISKTAVSSASGGLDFVHIALGAGADRLDRHRPHSRCMVKTRMRALPDPIAGCAGPPRCRRGPAWLKSMMTRSGRKLFIETIGLRPIARFRDDRELRLPLQQRAIAFAHNGVIVDQHNLRRHICASGLRTRAVGRRDHGMENETHGFARLEVQRPPSAAILSRMPVRPSPDFCAISIPVDFPLSSTERAILSRSRISSLSPTRVASACFAALVIASCAMR